jgi:hypothetical protein
MKTYKVDLSIGSTAYLHAERCEQEEHLTRFYRNGDVLAEYATSFVRQITEISPDKAPWLNGEVEVQSRG